MLERGEGRRSSRAHVLNSYDEARSFANGDNLYSKLRAHMHFWMHAEKHSGVIFVRVILQALRHPLHSKAPFMLPGIVNASKYSSCVTSHAEICSRLDVFFIYVVSRNTSSFSPRSSVSSGLFPNLAK